jgi:allantoicase
MIESTRTSRRPSGRASVVAVVQATDARQRDDAADARRLRHARIWRVFRQGEMCAIEMIVVDVAPNYPQQVSLTEHDVVIKTVSAKRSNPTFHVRILGSSGNLGAEHEHSDYTHGVQFVGASRFWVTA